MGNSVGFTANDPFWWSATCLCSILRMLVLPCQLVAAVLAGSGLAHVMYVWPTDVRAEPPKRRESRIQEEKGEKKAPNSLRPKMTKEVKQRWIQAKHLKSPVLKCW